MSRPRSAIPLERERPVVVRRHHDPLDAERPERLAPRSGVPDDVLMIGLLEGRAVGSQHEPRVPLALLGPKVGTVGRDRSASTFALRSLIANVTSGDAVPAAMADTSRAICAVQLRRGHALTVHARSLGAVDAATD